MKTRDLNIVRPKTNEYVPHTERQFLNASTPQIGDQVELSSGEFGKVLTTISENHYSIRLDGGKIRIFKGSDIIHWDANHKLKPQTISVLEANKACHEQLRTFRSLAIAKRELMDAFDALQSLGSPTAQDRTSYFARDYADQIATLRNAIMIEVNRLNRDQDTMLGL